jgi:RimJ/RimL family protein N-acetyltransferase
MILSTSRLLLNPVDWRDLPDLTALKCDPRAFAVMLGGVRTPAQVQSELAEDLAFWSRHGVGIWTIRERAGQGAFVGITGIMDRPDNRGLSLRFALIPAKQGNGLAREAAAAALRDAQQRAAIPRIIAVTRADNTASRIVLGGIGMRLCDRFTRDGHPMLVFEAVVGPAEASTKK